MKETLLQIVQSILSDMDSEDVNSISDTVEATQIASIVKDTYYNIIAGKDVPEHTELLKLTAVSDTSYPTHFYYPSSVKSISKLWYENSDGDYVPLVWLEPLDFILRTDSEQENYDTVYDKNGGTKLRIANDRDPRYFTSLDDEWVILDSYLSTTETTLQESKIRAYGIKLPVFTLSDSFTPDLDAAMFPYLKAEAKSTAMSLLKGGADAKVEQAARRLKNFIQNDRFKYGTRNPLSRYGRK